MSEIRISYKALLETLQLLRKDLGGESLYNTLWQSRESFEQRCEQSPAVVTAEPEAEAQVIVETQPEVVETPEVQYKDIFCDVKYDGTVQVNFESSEMRPTAYIRASMDDAETEKWLYITNCTCMGYTNNLFVDPSRKSKNCNDIEPYWPKLLTILGTQKIEQTSFDLDYNQYLGHITGLKFLYECVDQKMKDHQNSGDCMKSEELTLHINALKGIRDGFRKYQSNYKKINEMAGDSTRAYLPNSPTIALPACSDVDWSLSTDMAASSDVQLQAATKYKNTTDKIIEKMPEYESVRNLMVKEEPMINLPHAEELLQNISSTDRDITRVLNTFETKINFVKDLHTSIMDKKKKIDLIYKDIKSHQDIVDTYDMKGWQVDAKALADETDPFNKLHIIDSEYSAVLIEAQKQYSRYLEALIKKYTTPVITGLNKIRDQGIIEKVIKHVGLSLSPFGGLIPINLSSDGKSIEDIKNEQRMDLGQRLEVYLKKAADSAETRWVKTYDKLPENEMDQNEVEYVKLMAELDIVLKNYLDYYVYFNEIYEKDEDYKKLGAVYFADTQKIVQKIDTARAPRECFIYPKK